MRLSGREAVISADVLNEGGQLGTYELSLTVDNRTRSQKEVTLDASETGTVTFIVDSLSFGRHTVQVGGLTGQLVTSFSINWWLLAAIILVFAVLGWLVSRYLATRVKRSRRQENA